MFPTSPVAITTNYPRLPAGGRKLHVEIRSITKDSLGVAWSSDVIDDDKTGQATSSGPSTAADLSKVDAGVRGYRIKYQADGSTIVQCTDMIRPSTNTFNIKDLHENTHYRVCVKLFTDRTDSHRSRDSIHAAAMHQGISGGNQRASTMTSLMENFGDEWNDFEMQDEAGIPSKDVGRHDDWDVQATTSFNSSGIGLLRPTTVSTLKSSGCGRSISQSLMDIGSTGAPATMSCINASTGINSLSLALGSTLGAFLALGVIVAFVLAAKWQHVRRTRKLQLQLMQLLAESESNDSLAAAAGGCQLVNGVTGADGGTDVDLIAEVGQQRRYRTSANGDIEMQCFRSGSIVGERKFEDELGADSRRFDNDENDDSASSDFSADIILHTDASGNLHNDTGENTNDDVMAEATANSGSRLILDSTTCAGSFILANDEPTGGRTYSLLVPLSAVGVQPLLQAATSGAGIRISCGSETAVGSAASGGLQVLKLGGTATGPGKPVSGGVFGNGGAGGGNQSIVRLKLRKHATVDYSTVVDMMGEEWRDNGDEDYSTSLTPDVNTASPSGRSAQPDEASSHHNTHSDHHRRVVAFAPTEKEIRQESDIPNNNHLTDYHENGEIVAPNTDFQDQQQQLRAGPDDRTLSRSMSSVW